MRRQRGTLASDLFATVRRFLSIRGECPMCSIPTICLLLAVPTHQAPALQPIPQQPVIYEWGGADDPIVSRWADDIARLEALDDRPKGAVLFLGSSSIRRWEDIAEDMAPYPVVRRGYGGASYLDLDHYAKRLLAGQQPAAVVLFCGNDIKGDKRDRTADEVAALVESIAKTIRREHPKVPIVVIGVTPTPQRFHLWPLTKAANREVEKACGADPQLHFINTEAIFLESGERGPRPKADLFGPDDLHLNEDGYAAWSDRIKQELAQVLGEQPVGSD